MTEPHDSPHDEQLRRLLSDSVSGIEPPDRLAQIRASVRSDQKVVPMSSTRPWLYAASGVVATAAVIGAIAYATGAVPGNDHADDNPGPATHGPASSSTTSPSTSPTTSPTTSPVTPTAGTKAYAVYYVGDDPSGRPVLYREFHRGDSATPTDALALQDLSSLPLDPDYTTPWHAGDLVDAKVNPTEKVIFVTLENSSLVDRPGDISPAYAKAAVQQVVYTLQAAFRTRLPVQFLLQATNGYNPADRVLGVPTSQPVAQGKVLDTLSHISISDPNQDAKVWGKLTVTGVNNGFEGSALIYLEQNGKRYLPSPTIGGWMGDRLYPWTVTLDLTKVRPGQYTLVAQNDDPSGKGNPETDTRVIQVKPPQ